MENLIAQILRKIHTKTELKRKKFYTQVKVKKRYKFIPKTRIKSGGRTPITMANERN